jgi:pyruvate dehydrogenase E2 component (dihydrolipoamide acetyltransferase)
MEQGIFAGWLKADGAPIRAGESVFTLESDKATEDVECLDDGILHIPTNGPRQGEVVVVGHIIGFVLQPGEAIPMPADLAPSPQMTQPMSAGAATPTVGLPKRDWPTSSPRARRAAKRLGVDLQHVSGTGSTGRIRERDVLARANAAAPVRSMRKIIAERMLTSHLSTAPVTLMRTVDATNLVASRNRANESNTPASFTDRIVQLAALALQKHPVLNARWENDSVVLSDGIHIGIAVDTDAGLVVPVVREVSTLTLAQLSAQTRDLIERARQRKLSLAEMQGGTFTVTSLGAMGVDAFTPIINYPECAALGVGRIKRCPVVVGEQIVIRDQMTLSLTFDHRTTDGAPAARFLQTLSDLIENARAT